jgi:elongator complex protein 1
MTMFPATASSSHPKSKQVVSFNVIAETRRVTIITHGGDITTISLEDPDSLVRRASLEEELGLMDLL